jgi:hypothetical protein
MLFTLINLSYPSTFQPLKPPEPFAIAKFSFFNSAIVVLLPVLAMALTKTKQG